MRINRAYHMCNPQCRIFKHRKKMKFCVILILAIVAGAEDTDKEDIFGNDDQKKQCMQELKLDAKDIREIDTVDDLENMTKDEKCLLRCILMKRGAIDKDGALIPDEFDEEISKGLNIDFSKCVPQKGIADLCEQSYVLTQCVVKLVLEATEKS